ncbi:molybdopterin converting factor subunit 1 [Thalassotalea mangrovi]|uniref:Molybdopterin synthase sulfur carrier subunit n=1 Tax=Thalassotalea mangrovi TaxID=2572245 RepID=A0A4V5NWM3_9GAMM|nr:molybdopterin converting factor subunit 1 [Thalassotalea mangrovi]TKB47392.1 molybdopterin converting factor subunit 1 [Thalassotalea mangrovi]
MATGAAKQDIRVLFFAQFREQLGCDQLALASTDVTDIASIKHTLAKRGDMWQQVFTNSSLLVAVNQQMVQDNIVIKPGDEIAFFPPVTGG